MTINLQAPFHAETFYRALRERGLDPCANERGVSFNVGPQAEDVLQWAHERDADRTAQNAFAKAAWACRTAGARFVELGR